MAKPTQIREKLSVADSGSWQFQTAEARFSELFRRARTEGPQLVTRQGKEQVVVLPIGQFEQLTARSGQPKSLVQLFAESPKAAYSETTLGQYLQSLKYCNNLTIQHRRCSILPFRSTTQH